MKITTTQCGQPRPYADSIFAGTIEANSEQEARDGLQKMRGKPIRDKRSVAYWYMPYFAEFFEVGPGKWQFSIVEEYTD